MFKLKETALALNLEVTFLDAINKHISFIIHQPISKREVSGRVTEVKLFQVVFSILMKQPK